MDRRTERRLLALKRWRTARAADLKMDPGVFAPNSALEAIAWLNPSSAEQLTELVELKGWFKREFGAEVVEALAASAAHDRGAS